MAGRKKLDGKSTETRGGARPGAGRKPKAAPDYDEQFKRDVKRVLGRLKRQHGVSFLEKAFGMMYEAEVQDTVKASLLKTYAEICTVKKSVKDVNVKKSEAPAIGLPPKREDPALRVVNGNE